VRALEQTFITRHVCTLYREEFRNKVIWTKGRFTERGILCTDAVVIMETVTKLKGKISEKISTIL
jgi:hypothetical protein